MPLLTEGEVSKIGEKAFPDGLVRVLCHEISRKSDKKIGYLGQHFTLSVNVALEGGTARKTFFVKTYDGKENFVEQTGIFQREVDFYRFVADDLRESCGRTAWCPAYFFSKKRVLVLEDLSEKGFLMAEESLILDKMHLEMALRNLAAMHASSVAFEAQESKPLPAMYPTVFLNDILYDEEKQNSPCRKWIAWQIEDLLEGIEHLPKYTPVQVETIRKGFTAEMMRIFPLSKKSKKYRNVLTHGDMWRNNLLFRYSSQHLPIECTFVDFQFVRYAPPAHDVMHLLHYSIKKDDRERDEAHYLRLYYKNLQERLREFGLNIENEMTEEEFEQSCKEYKELALIQCLLSFHYILGGVTLDAGVNKNFDDQFHTQRRDYMKEFFSNPSYTERVNEVFEELIDGYILKE